MIDSPGIWTEFNLPFPPSSNSLTFNKRHGRAKTPLYEAWITHAGLKLNRQKVVKIRGRYHLRIELGRRLKKDGTVSTRKRDLGNLEKAVSDLLVRHKIVECDSLMESLFMRWSDSVKGARVTVEEDVPVLAGAT